MSQTGGDPDFSQEPVNTVTGEFAGRA